MAADADRHLLFGLLALQNGLIDQAQLLTAFHAWTRDKAQPLDDHLQALGYLDADGRAAVAAMVALHLKTHGNDAGRSLAAIPASRSTRDRLAALGDPEVGASIAHLDSGPTTAADPDGTASYAVGTATSDGQRFRVLRPHARGGLGAVFVALDTELHREVALKQILDSHADDDASRQRFLLEAEITGGLEHPGIVPVYGLGTYKDGRPYYAMRFVRGDSLKEAIERFHADESLRHDPGRRSLGLRQLLRRFTDVCNAIEYAHNRGVLHRDIKPGNVIVGRHGETLVVDWGLAKATGRAEPASRERTLRPDSSGGDVDTLPGTAMGTPAYMSPEQAGGDLDRLGPRSDVYSLGATLYCLLTGQPPFAGDAVEVIPRVRHGDFRPPRALDPAIDRSLEAVCLKAMALQPESRYGSCRALAEDVERWMADEPVSAFPEPPAARAGRWMRRHRTLVSGAAILLATVAVAAGAGLVLLGRKNREIAVERNVARTAADQAQAVNDFLTEDLLGQADPDVNNRDQKVTVEALLHRAAQRIDGNPKLSGRPEVEATLRLTIGKTFFKLSDLREAERHLRRAVDLRRQALGADDPRTLADQEALADFLNRGPGRFAEAEPLARQTWRARARMLGPEHRDTLDSLDTFATTLQGLGRVEESIASFRECLAARRRVLGARHPDTLTSMNNLAYFLMTHGAWAEAVPLARESLASFEDRRPETERAAGAVNLVTALYLNGDLDEADRLLGPAVDRATRRLGAEDLRTSSLRGWQVRVWIEVGRVESAVTLGRDVLAAKRRLYPAGHYNLGYSVADLGWGLVLIGRFAEAETLLAESRAVFAKAPPIMAYYLGWAGCWHGASQAGLGRYEEAEPLLLAAEEALRDGFVAPRRFHQAALEQLVKLYEAWGKPDRAETWRKKLAGTR